LFCSEISDRPFFPFPSQPFPDMTLGPLAVLVCSFFTIALVISQADKLPSVSPFPMASLKGSIRFPLPYAEINLHPSPFRRRTFFPFCLDIVPPVFGFAPKSLSLPEKIFFPSLTFRSSRGHFPPEPCHLMPPTAQITRLRVGFPFRPLRA